MKKEEIILIIGILALAAVPSFIFNTTNTNWNVYYERQVREAVYYGEIPDYDNLSYLGRGMTYVPGYMAAKAGFLEIFGLPYSFWGDFAFSLFSNIALMVSLLFLFGKMKLPKANSCAAMVLFVSSAFVFLLMQAHLLHVISLALLFFSLGFFLDSRKKTGIALLASATLVHSFSLVLFLIFSMGLAADSLNRKNLLAKLKDMAIAAAAAMAIFLLLYSKTIMENGMPYEIMPGDWGWLLHWGVEGIYADFLFTGPVLIFSAIYGITSRKYRGICSMALLLLMAYLFITFRLNIAFAFLGAVAFAKMFDDKKIILFASILALASMIFMTISLGMYSPNCLEGGLLSEACERPLEFAKSLEPDAMLTYPLLGHATAFSAEKKVLADLYVEYANEEKLKDAFAFQAKNNFSMAEKWNISLAVTSNGCDYFDRIYDNGYYMVCKENKG